MRHSKGDHHLRGFTSMRLALKPSWSMTATSPVAGSPTPPALDSWSGVCAPACCRVLSKSRDRHSAHYHGAEPRRALKRRMSPFARLPSSSIQKPLASTARSVLRFG